MYRRKNKARWALTLITFFMTIIMFSTFIFGIINKSSETADVGLLGWSVGNVGADGKIVESKESIYTRELNLVEGMEITYADEATVKYKVVFYDEDKNYISTTEDISKDYDSTSTPETAKYFRVIVTPRQVDGENVKINSFTAFKYANQLEIVYNK